MPSPEPMDAVVVLLLLQVPPDMELLRVMVLPLHTDSSPRTSGLGLTVANPVTLHPVGSV